jgi:hypothetical protein
MYIVVLARAMARVNITSLRFPTSRQTNVHTPIENMRIDI